MDEKVMNGQKPIITDTILRKDKICNSCGCKLLKGEKAIISRIINKRTVNREYYCIKCKGGNLDYESL